MTPGSSINQQLNVQRRYSPNQPMNISVKSTAIGETYARKKQANTDPRRQQSAEMKRLQAITASLFLILSTLAAALTFGARGESPKNTGNGIVSRGGDYRLFATMVEGHCCVPHDFN